MRVLQVSSHYPPYHTAGAERACAGLAAALAADGHEVQVAAPVPEQPEGPIRVRTLPGGAPRPLRKLVLDYASPAATSALSAIIDDFAPDVVHVHNVYAIGSQLVRAASRRTPTLVTLHDYWPMDVVSPAYRDGQIVYPRRAGIASPWTWMHRRWHRRQLAAAHLVAPSHFLASRVGRALDREVRVLANGLDLPSVVTSAEPRMLYVGRLVPEKGLDTVLPAMVEAARRHGWQIDVVGDGPLRPLLKPRFPSVNWHGRTDPAPFYGAASILIVPSIWPENAPYVVLEGMTRGLTVIAAASGGIPEQIDDGETGFLFGPGDVAQFRTTLERAITQPALCSRIGARAIAGVTALAWPRVAQRHAEIYHRLLSELPRDQATDPSTSVIGLEVPRV
jgi:glycosyltransferase involved in cell wall biosynthesis